MGPLNLCSNFIDRRWSAMYEIPNLKYKLELGKSKSSSSAFDTIFGRKWFLPSPIVFDMGLFFSWFDIFNIWKKNKKTLNHNFVLFTLGGMKRRLQIVNCSYIGPYMFCSLMGKLCELHKEKQT